ncbi:MAG: formate dehydrogenase accessory sulfurtransferase FdhD [Pseudomonadota bacterium]
MQQASATAPSRIAPERPGVVEFDIVRHQGGQAIGARDEVAEEFPVALVYNGISHAVMMATPRDLEEFAVGFSLSEGIVGCASEIHDLEVCFAEDSVEVRLSIAQPAFLKLKERRRALAGRTGCGVCGIESIALLDLAPERITRPLAPLAAGGAALGRAARELLRHQELMCRTGGVHAAAWCAADGAVLKVFEDVGRHNGMDKLIGHLALRRIAMQDGFVFLSSRASYELVRKAARMNIPLLATISAPTSLAINIARQAGMQLASFCRRDGFVDYTAGQPRPAAPAPLACVKPAAPPAPPR